MATVLPSRTGRPSVAELAFTILRKADKAAKKDPEPAAGAIPKEQASQHGTYMAVVRSLACRRCGKPSTQRSRSQFCHADEGKGMGIKTDVRRGWAGCARCHQEVGEGKMAREEKRRLNAEYAASTRAEVLAKGLWPAALPKWKAKA